MRTGSPAATLLPAWATTWKTTPVMWARTSSGIGSDLSFEKPRVNVTVSERTAGHDAPVQRQRGPDPFDPVPVQRRGQPLDRLLPVRPAGDDLRQQASGFGLL